jgi:hypothetical protein
MNIDVPILKSSNGEAGDYVEFVQVALALGKYVVKNKAKTKGEVLEEVPEKILGIEGKVALLSPQRTIAAKQFTSGETFKSGHYHASTIIQRQVKLRKLKKNAKLAGYSSSGGASEVIQQIGMAYNRVSTTGEVKEDNGDVEMV